jgi:hypothetical protein
MKYNIREIEEKDNKEVENVIRACLIEFGEIMKEQLGQIQI